MGCFPCAITCPLRTHILAFSTVIRGCVHTLHVVVPLRSGNADSCEYLRIPPNTPRIPFSRAPEYPLNTPTVIMATRSNICTLGVFGGILNCMLHVLSTFQPQKWAGANVNHHSCRTESVRQGLVVDIVNGVLPADWVHCVRFD